MEKYTPKLGDKLCDEISTTSLGLRDVCKKLALPYSTVTNWIYTPGHELHYKYQEAKMLQLQHLYTEILKIADNTEHDYITVTRNGKTVQIQNREAIARTNLRIRTRMNIITKLAPIMNNMEEDFYSKRHQAQAQVKNTTRPIPDTPHARRAMEIGPTIYHTDEITPIQENTVNNTSLPSGEGRGGATSAEVNTPGSSPKTALKPATSKPLANDTQLRSNTSLPSGKGWGGAVEVYTILPEQWAKMNKREKRIAVLQYNTEHIPGKTGYLIRAEEAKAQLEKEMKKTAKEKRQEDKADLEEERSMSPEMLSTVFKWEPLPGGGFSCSRQVDSKVYPSPYRWG